MKYIMIADLESGVPFPAFCMAPVTHRELAAKWRRDDSRRVVSAGYCRFLADGKVETLGESTSLGLKPAPDDARLIEAYYRSTLAIALPIPASEYANDERPRRY